MATLLVTRKMHPALAARVEASVRGRRGAPSGGSRASSPRAVAALRLALLATIGAAAMTLFVMHRREQQAAASARSALVAAAEAEANALDPAGADLVPRAASWLERLSGTWEGDVVAPELRAPGALASRLTAPWVYVRGPAAGFSSEGAVEGAAAASTKDAFVACLVTPPASRTERDLLGRVRAAYARAPDPATANVVRLHDAEVGLPFLLPPWAERVRREDDRDELTRLRRAFDRAPLAEAKIAARARLLVAVIDEPPVGNGPTELDGENAHDVRVGIVDLAAAKVLFRMRARTDPSWISVARRPEYARGLDACALAMDARDRVLTRP